MKTNKPNPLLAKTRLFLLALATCVIATGIILLIIHPEVWVVPVCAIIVAIAVLGHQFYLLRKK